LAAAASSIRDELDRAMEERKTARERFETSERGILDLVTRGLLAPRCALCGVAELYCEYGGHKKHSREKARWDRWAAQEQEARNKPNRILGPPPIPERKDLKPITTDDVQRAVEQLRAKQTDGA
jgi:hypothetical protein